MEQWRKIPELCGYEASSRGNIRSVDRVVYRTNARGDVIAQPLRGKVLSPNRCKNGYRYVSIGGRSYQVHRLVALAWVNGYEPGLDAAHKNNVRHENRPENLNWKTRKANIADQLTHGTRLLGERQNGAKLNPESVLEMRRLRRDGFSWRSIGDRFGVAATTAKSAITGSTWSHAQPSRWERAP